MRNQDLDLELQRLRTLIEQTSNATSDLNLMSHWGRYLCVMVAGFLEQSIQTIYQDFANRSAEDPRVARYVSRRLRRVRNPNAEEFLQTAGHFDNQWRLNLQDFFSGDARPKEAINSIMSLRNNIAHGGNASIAPNTVRDYLERSVQVLELIEDQCHD